MQELIKDETNRILGRHQHKCRICNAEGMFRSYLVREMMYGTRDEFEYFECDNCGCLQIAAVPDNLGDYYQENYYSYEKMVEDGEEIVFTNDVIETPRTLDVGCGAGLYLLQLAIDGHNNLFGCDPFIQNDIRYGDRVYIRKCDIHSMERGEGFSRIIMSDSFEHVTDPLEVLCSAKKLLTDNGVLEIYIPTFPNIAFDLFGPHWYQLDAPRHITLHSIKSIRILAQEAGLRIVDLKYNASNAQIIRSFFYQHGVTFFDMTSEMLEKYFSPEMIKEIDTVTEKANAEGNGDHMCILMTRNNEG